jgi:AraC-like DNA-binding protein
VRSFVEQPGRDLMRNARLFAALTQAIDDALIAVFDAKYHHALWRPVTAIRNGDNDGNDATERDPSWLPFLATPMHPEYPCAHCIQSGVVGAFLKYEIGSGAPPVITTKSSTASGGERRWTTVEAMVQEVGHALGLVHGQPTRPWTLDALAREAGTSRSVLAERFTALLGKPPMQYLTQWRLTLAAHRLATTTKPAATIAFEVGYESEAAFSRTFRREFGAPPATWRRSAAASTAPADQSSAAA